MHCINRTGFKKKFLIKNYQSFLLGKAMSTVRECYPLDISRAVRMFVAFSSQHGSAILDAAMLRDMVPVNRMRGRSAWLISSWWRRIAVSLLGLSSRLFLCSGFLSFPDDIYSCRIFMDFERFFNELSYTLYFSGFCSFCFVL